MDCAPCGSPARHGVIDVAGLCDRVAGGTCGRGIPELPPKKREGVSTGSASDVMDGAARTSASTAGWCTFVP